MFDIAVNLTNPQFHHPQLSMQRAREAGLEGLLIVGCDPEESQASLALAQTQADFAWSTAGIHPHDAKDADDAGWQLLEQLWQRSQVVAVGECGLDYNRNYSPQDQQRRVFERQLAYAAELKMPVYMHCREGFEDFLPLVARYRDSIPTACLHCFTGTEAELKACLELDLYIGITGWICDERRGQELRELVRLIPDNRLLAETDAPFLLPRDLPKSARFEPKSRCNEPAYLPHIVDTIAQCRDQQADIVRQLTLANSRAFLGLDL